MKRKPNFLLIVSEDLSPHLGCYGDPWARTPALDRLAESGARFDVNYCGQPVCSPGRATLLTGLYPHQHGQIGLATHKFHTFPGIENLPKLLKENGYRTGVIGKIHVLPEEMFELDAHYADGEKMSFSSRSPEWVAASAREFMEESCEQPFFLMVNYSDAHLPFLGQSFGYPEELHTPENSRIPSWVGLDSPRMREVAANYYNCISRLDTCVDKLLEAMREVGKSEETLIAYTSDHGSQFPRGKTCVYEPGARVPLILSGPGVPRGVSTRFLSSGVDVMPTFLAAAELPIPPAVEGVNLLDLFDTERPDPCRKALVCEWHSSHPPVTFPQRAIRNDRYKMIWSPVRGRDDPSCDGYFHMLRTRGLDWPGFSKEELEASPERVQRAYQRWRRPPEYQLFDLQSDPDEWEDLSESLDHQEVLRELQEALLDWQRKTRDPMMDPERLECFMAECDTIAREYYPPLTEPQGAFSGKKGSFVWRYQEYLRNP